MVFVNKSVMCIFKRNPGNRVLDGFSVKLLGKITLQLPDGVTVLVEIQNSLKVSLSESLKFF